MKTKPMQLVEQHIIDRDDPRWLALDAASFLSKNLYNAANYILRQEYISNHRFIPYTRLDKLMKRNPDYCALPRKVSQWVLKQVDHDWQAFFDAQKEWVTQPEKFGAKPRLPHYKHKTKGRNLLTYTAQAVSQLMFETKGVIKPSGLDITVKTQQTTFDQVRIVPHSHHYTVEVIYTVVPQQAAVNPDYVLSVDLGIDNLAALASNQPGFIPLLVNGRPLKSINQWYNKELARLKSELPVEQYTSKRIRRLTHQRNCRVDAFLHRASRRIIESMRLMGLGKLVIGKNDGWKQEVNLGKRTNQNFVQIPHARFITMLTYKAELEGIQVIVTEESYTSKCSFLDNEGICEHEVYAGRRIHRGLFRAGDGRKINADVNGAYNILRKVIPNAMSNGIAGAVVHPVWVPPA